MRARYKGGDKELSVSLYQAVILLLFNDQTEIGFNDIKTNTNMGESIVRSADQHQIDFDWTENDELRRTLQSLACANKKVLRKRPAGKDVNNSDIFYFNDDFTDPKTRVHINSIQAKETVRRLLPIQIRSAFHKAYVLARRITEDSERYRQ